MENEAVITGAMITATAGAGILIGAFLLFRKVVLWYWKLDHIEKQLDRTVELLSELVARTPRRDETPPR